VGHHQYCGAYDRRDSCKYHRHHLAKKWTKKMDLAHQL